MKIDFIEPGPALLVKNTKKVLVIADLHLGIESDLAQHGIHFSSRSGVRAARVRDCIRETDPDLLVLLGDIKHSIPVLSRQEYVELPEIFQEFRRLVPMAVLPGNHDIGIERFLNEGELQKKEGVVIDGVGYLHGHTYPDPSLCGHLILAGHHHPLASLRDDVGCSLRAPAYLLASVTNSCLGLPPGKEGGEPTRVMFMPAFNELSGYDIRKIVKDPFSPLSRCMNTDTTEVFLTDGTYLGPVSSLEEDGRD
jgi:metallophosphoesterase superfamily enzyme